MQNLVKVQSKWLDLYRTLRVHPEIGSQFTPPFVSVAPPGYNPRAVPSLLYVGKAERASDDPNISPYRDAFDETPTLAYCQKGTTDFLDEIRAGRYDSAFWRFARQLGHAAAGEVRIDDLQNVVWTNVCKLTDLCRGNPSGKLLAVQTSLAVETLQEEIQAYDPMVVVFLSDEYADIIRKIVGDMNDTNWQREAVDSDWLWWRGPLNGLPAILWTRHPERARRQYLDACADALKRLVQRQ